MIKLLLIIMVSMTLNLSIANTRFYDFDQEMNYSQELNSIPDFPYEISKHKYQKKIPSKKLFITIHGFLDNCGYLRDLHSFFFKEGFDIICLELPGHGLSTGPIAEIEDFSQYGKMFETLNFTELKKQYSTINFFAHSTGAVAHFEAHRANISPEFDKIILMAPLGRSKAFRPSMILHSVFGSLVSQVPRKKSKQVRFLEIKAQDPSYIDFTPMNWVRAFKKWDREIQNLTKINDQKITIFFGTKDKVIEKNYTERLYKRLFPNSETIYIKNGTHHLDLDDRYISQIFYSKLAKALQ